MRALATAQNKLSCIIAVTDRLSISRTTVYRLVDKAS